MISKIEPPQVVVIDPNQNIYHLNEYEFLKLRINIKKHNISGWMWEDVNKMLHIIHPDGKLEVDPPQFELYPDMSYELL